jgi:hypothetical protein
MAADLAASASHPAVAGLLGLASAGVAGGVVAMAWSVQARQIRLAAQQARRQLVVMGGADAAQNGSSGAASAGPAAPAAPANGAGPAAPVVIEGLDTLVAGDQARYRVRLSGARKVESWAVGGGAVTQAPDPAHPDELLLIADEPGNLTIMVRVREGMTERRGVKSVTAVPDVAAAAPAAPIRLFLHGWGLIAVAVLIIGFAGTLDALGTLASADFIALSASLVALLAVTGVARGPGEQGGHSGQRKGVGGPAP